MKAGKRTFLVLLICFLAAGCTSVLKAKKGDELAVAGAWDEAVLNYAEAAKKEPENIAYRLKYIRARVEAAKTHHERGSEYLKEGKHEAALLEFQAALLLDPTFKKAEEDLKKAKSQIDSLYHYGKGMELLKEDKKNEAKKSFQKSLKLNPANTAAAVELEKIREAKGAVVAIDGYELDLKSVKPITLEFKDVGVKTVFGVLSKLSGINFVFDSDVSDKRTSIFLKDSTFREALELLLATNNLSKKVVSENTVLVYPANPQKKKQYEELVVKVFYLTNIDAKKAVNLIRTMVKAKDLYVHDSLNAIVVRAEPSAIELAHKILEATDLADAEVVLAVDIMEVSRNKAHNLGIDLPDSVTVNIPQTAVGSISAITLKDLGRFDSQDLLITIPSAVINLKVEDRDSELLANPRIRVKNGEKAKIHIGDRVPIITAVVSGTAATTSETVQYQDVGLKLEVQPVIRPNDEIDLKITLEVSSLGTRTTTTAGSVVYQIGTRNVETNLRLYDGETQVIGGLINDEERNTVVKVPGLGEIPIIGRLFANTDKSKVKTDILLSITPHIVRRLEVPGEDVTRILSGKESEPSLGPVMEIPQREQGEALPEEAAAPEGAVQPEEGAPPEEGVEPLPEGAVPQEEVSPPEEGVEPPPGLEPPPPPPPPPGIIPPPPEEEPPPQGLFLNRKWTRKA